jgi:hypothetical protein
VNWSRKRLENLYTNYIYIVIIKRVDLGLQSVNFWRSSTVIFVQKGYDRQQKITVYHTFFCTKMMVDDCQNLISCSQKSSSISIYVSLAVFQINSCLYWAPLKYKHARLNILHVSVYVVNRAGFLDSKTFNLRL